MPMASIAYVKHAEVPPWSRPPGFRALAGSARSAASCPPGSGARSAQSDAARLWRRRDCPASVRAPRCPPIVRRSASARGTCFVTHEVVRDPVFYVEPESFLMSGYSNVLPGKSLQRTRRRLGGIGGRILHQRHSLEEMRQSLAEHRVRWADSATVHRNLKLY